MDSMLGAAPLWCVLTAGLGGAAVGWFLPRAVLRYSPVTDELDPAPSRPVLMVLTATLFVLVASYFGLSWQIPAYYFFVAVAVVLAVIDLRHHLLPNAGVLPALVFGFVLLAVAAIGENAWGALLRAVLGALVLFALYLVLAIISPAGLGMGDVKLAAALGLFLGFQGWGALFVGAVLASVVGMVVGFAVLASRRGGLHSDIPFGPSMLAGALVAVVWGEMLAREYLLPGLY